MGLISRVSSRTYRLEMASQIKSVAKKGTGFLSKEFYHQTVGNGPVKYIAAPIYGLTLLPLRYLVQYGGPVAARHWRFAKVELAPPNGKQLAEFVPMATKKFEELVSLGFLKWTVRDTAINTLIAAEILVWFCLGEIIGKGSLRGYQPWVYERKTGKVTSAEIKEHMKKKD